MDPDYVNDENAYESNDSDHDGDVAFQRILSEAVDCVNENNLGKMKLLQGNQQHQNLLTKAVLEKIIYGAKRT